MTHGGGTGGNAAIDGVSGRQQDRHSPEAGLENGGYLEDGYISSFMDFVPRRDPKLAILVAVDEPRAGTMGAVVRACFQEIASEGLSYMGSSLTSRCQRAWTRP